MEIKNKKKEQRRIVLTKRNAMHAGLRQTLSAELTERLLQMPVLQEAKVVFAYSAIDSEVDVWQLIDWALANDKTVLLPRVEGKEMSFYEFHDRSQLIGGVYGILEPDPNKCKQRAPKNGVCIVPGVGFDQKGHRLGHGGGYYDKYFAEYPEVIRVGVCFEEQLLPEIAVDAYDLQMEIVVTPKRVLVESTEYNEEV